MAVRWAFGILTLFLLGGCRDGAAAPLQSAAPTDSRAATSLHPFYTVSHGMRSAVRRSPEVTWCSSGGAPMVGLPVLDAQGRAYVVTSDGYLHAFERDGRYRFSYTVAGTPLGSVSLRPSDGAILVGTTSRRVYAIHQSGSLTGSFHTVSPVWSGLFALNPSTVVFLGMDQRLYALSNTGAARYRVRAPGTPTTDPVVAQGDVVWVGLADGAARFTAAYRLEKFPLPSAVEQVVAIGADAVARAGGRAYRLHAAADPRDLGSTDYLAAGGGRWARVQGRRVAFLGKGAAPTVQLSAAPSAPPALATSRLWAPFQDGTLEIVGLGGAEDEKRRITVADEPLSTPVLDAQGSRALVATRSGEFCAIELHDDAAGESARRVARPRAPTR